MRACRTRSRTPRWLRDLGRSSWLLVGLLLLLLGLIWLLAETYTITGPMVCALIVSVVAMPVVRLLDRHMPRALAAALVLVAVAADRPLHRGDRRCRHHRPERGDLGGSSPPASTGSRAG